LKYWLSLPFLLFSLTLSPEAVARISVNFQAKVSVTGARLVLADIAVIEPSGTEADSIGQLPVGGAPIPGAGKELSTVSIITSLRNRPEVADVDWQGSDTIVVQREGTSISEQQLQQIIAEYLKENSAKLPKTEIRFTMFRLPKQLVLPSGELSWKVTPSHPEIMGSSSFSIFFSVDGKPSGNCVVRGKLEAIADVATAATTLHRGDLITEDKVTMERQTVNNLDNPVLNKEQLIGKQVDRTLKTGRAIEQRHIVSPPIVKDGEMLKVFARKGALQISTSGIAKANGRLGETIQVKNISSNKLIYCRVDGPGMVSVEF
jgi:flagella basal body P-ring formation protein FlgA